MIDRHRAAGTVPLFEIIAEYDPFHRKTRVLRSELGFRVTTTVDGASHALFGEQDDMVASAVVGYLRTVT